MSNKVRQLSAKPLKGRFNLEDAARLTEKEINLLAELDAEAIQKGIPDAEKTAEERLFEQRLLARLMAHVSQG